MAFKESAFSPLPSRFAESTVPVLHRPSLFVSSERSGGPGMSAEAATVSIPTETEESTEVVLEFSQTMEEVVIEPITTANKNIQSYYARQDQATYVPESQMYPACATAYPPLRLLITPSAVHFESASRPLEGTPIFSGFQYASTTQNSATLLFSTVQAAYKAYVKDAATAVASVAVEDNSEVHRPESPTDGSGKNLAAENETTQKDNAVTGLKESFKEEYAPGNRFVQLIFHDLFTRHELISMTDIVLNQMGFRGMMLLPLSLALSFSLGLSHCVFAYPEGFGFVDDFMVADSYNFKLSVAAQMAGRLDGRKESTDRENSTGSVSREEEGERLVSVSLPGAAQAAEVPRTAMLVDDQDFAEEFTRLRPVDDALCFACDSCERREDTEEKIVQHLLKDHGGEEPVKQRSGARKRLRADVQAADESAGLEKEAGKEKRPPTWFKYEPGTTYAEALENRLRFVFVPDKRALLKENVFSVFFDFEGAKRVEEPEERAFKGAALFAQLECSKELWLTGWEWRAVRMRALKEKILFFI